jgi:hypothetical protein
VRLPKNSRRGCAVAKPAYYFVGGNRGQLGSIRRATGETLLVYNRLAMPPLRGLGILLCLTPLLAACTVYGEHPVRSFSDATSGAGFERSLWNDVKDKDWKDLQLHLASNFTFLTLFGPLDRPAALAAFQQMDVKDFSLGDLQTQLNGDTFVVTYTIVLRGSSGGKPLSEQPQRRMTVWQQQKSGWVALAQTVLGTP